MPLSEAQIRAHNKWAAANPDKMKGYKRGIETRRRPAILLARAKTRAKIRSLPFNIDISDIIIPDVCPVLGIPINQEGGLGRMHDSSPSLDRIRPELGYIKGNVHVISWRANRLKGDATTDELQKIAAYFG